MRESSMALQELGLSKKEGEAYIAALVLGEASVSDIALRAGISRTTAYVLLEALRRRGLVSSRGDEKMRTYVAETPERLRTLVQDERERITRRETILERAIPMLMAMFHADSTRPHVQYLEGVDGIMEVRRMFLEEQGDAYQIVPLEEVEKMNVLVADRPAHLESFSKGGGSMYALLVGVNHHLESIPVFPGSEIRLLPVADFPVHAEITVRGSSLYLFTYDESIMAVIVKNKAIADAAKALFQLAWKGSVEYPGKKGWA